LPYKEDERDMWENDFKRKPEEIAEWGE